METGLSRLFGIEKEEKNLIGILLFQSVFLGIFYGVFNITAHAIFLSRFDETDMARAYIISGLAGSALTYLYSVFQARIRFSLFSILNLVFILLVIVFLWILIRLNPAGWVVYAIFIMLGPLFVLTMLGYWGTAGRLFTLRQGRRFFGIIDVGLIAGIIISSFSIPVLLSLNIGTHDILLISAFSILGAAIIQSVITNRHRQNLAGRKENAQEKAGIRVFRKDKYIRTMGIFIALSVLVVFFVQYSFMAVTRARYPEENEMARFLGFFEGSMMIFTLLIKTFIFSYLVKNHGLKVTLALSPVIIGIFSIVAVIIGTTRGFIPGTSGFMIFFLMLAISRLFSKALKDSVETPAFKVLYQTLGEKLRYSVQSAIDGTVNEIAALASGLILTGLGALVFIDLIHFSWVLILITILWVVYSLRLYNEYRGSIRQTLNKKAEQIEVERGDEEGVLSSTKSGEAIYIDNNYFNVITDSEFRDNLRYNTALLEKVLIKAEKDHNPDILPLLESLDPKDIADTDLLARIENLVAVIKGELREKGLGKGSDLILTVESSTDRKLHLRAMMAGNEEPVITDMMRLIRDQDPGIVREALYIAGRFHIKELLPEICECLDNEEVATDAYSVLKSFGRDALPSLAGHYFRSSDDIKVRMLILRLYADAGGADAISFLLPRIWSVNKFLRKEAVKGLIKCEYKADDETRNKLFQEVRKITGMLTWNLSARVSLDEKGDEILSRSMEEEANWWFELLFDLLSFIYDKRSLDQIKENLESGTVESVNFALEMLDIVIDDEIKPRLNALLDVVPAGEKLKNLFQFYPGDIPVYEHLVSELVNKDYNEVGVWTKACAIRSLSRLEPPSKTDFLVALLFSGHRMLREESCYYLDNNFKQVYAECSGRLPVDYRRQLNTLVNGDFNVNDLTFVKLKSLSRIFEDIAETHLVSLAEKVLLVKEDDDQAFQDDYLAWPVDSNDGEELRFNWGIAGSVIEGDAFPGRSYYILPLSGLESFIFYNERLSKAMMSCLDKKLNDE